MLYATVAVCVPNNTSVLEQGGPWDALAPPSAVRRGSDRRASRQVVANTEEVRLFRLDREVFDEVIFGRDPAGEKKVAVRRPSASSRSKSIVTN